MKITNISCTQFAGVRDRNISFNDGINVIYGKNESGKSTLVNLLSRTLFQDAKLDRRRDKEFLELYFPSAKKGSKASGDFADGKITIETENGTYTLSKEWGFDSRCTLSTPDGVLRDQSKINEIMKEALVYGEGVYSDMLFSSQRNTDVSLQTILDASKKTDAKQEITNAVSQAFSESDGISVDAIEEAIKAKIDEIEGKHWDFDRETPARKTGGGKWSNGLGEILKAYYALEDANAVLTEISRLEEEADKAATDYVNADSATRVAEEKYNSFNTFSSRLAVQSERKKSIERIDSELKKITEVLSRWPQLNEALEKAKALQDEKYNRNILDICDFIKKTKSEITDEDLATAGLPYPDKTEIVQIRTAQRRLTTLENKLCGMNLSAAVNMLNSNKMTITSLRTGEAIDITDGVASITEAVEITIPDVAKIQLSPADVNVEEIELDISECKKVISDIFEKYEVTTLEQLEAYAQKIDDAKEKIESINYRISRVLGNISIEEFENISKSTHPVERSSEEIERDIRLLCGSTDVATFITKTQTIIDGYKAEYGSINELKAKAFDFEMELKKAKESVSSVDDIPAEFVNISDPDMYLEALKIDLNNKQTVREIALTQKTASSSKLESFKENITGDPVTDVEKRQRAFDEKKALLNHWVHIYEVFKEQKENINDNPMQDIADRFAYYLGAISDGRVTTEFPQADKLNMNIYSENSLLDYSKLSEGTKETVSLAFRLAVLDHLFPDGGGVIVFDDPFTDMDDTRTALSCELIKECAKNHQVIFLTCREDYLDMLSGNQILF